MGRQWAREACESGTQPNVQALRQGVAERIAAAGGRVDYVEVRAASVSPCHGTHMVWSTLSRIWFGSPPLKCMALVNGLKAGQRIVAMR